MKVQYKKGNPAMASALVALGAGWTPEEAARYQVELLRGLAADPKAQRLYLRKVQIVEAVRAKTTDGLQEDTLHEAKTKNLDKAAAVADGRSSSSSGQPTGAATKSRGRRRKSEAQRRKSVEKLQHKKLQSRCEAAATKVGGSPPRVLARVLACCGRFWQLLDHEGGEMMKRLKEAEAAKSKAAAEDSAGLNAMRAALAATMLPSTPDSMDEDHALPHNPQVPRVRVERRGLLAGREQQPERMEPFVFGQSATPGASSGGGGAADKLDSKKTYAASLLKRAPDGGRT